MTIYDDLKAVADELLAVSDDTFGQIGAVRRLMTFGGSATSTTSAVEITIDYPINLAIFPVDQRDVDGTFIKAGDFRVLVSASQPAGHAAWDQGNVVESITEIAPTTTDKLVCSEGVLTIVDAGNFAPAGNATHYKMVARK